MRDRPALCSLHKTLLASMEKTFCPRPAEITVLITSSRHFNNYKLALDTYFSELMFSNDCVEFSKVHLTSCVQIISCSVRIKSRSFHTKARRITSCLTDSAQVSTRALCPLPAPHTDCHEGTFLCTNLPPGSRRTHCHQPPLHNSRLSGFLYAPLISSLSFSIRADTPFDSKLNIF